MRLVLAMLETIKKPHQRQIIRLVMYTQANTSDFSIIKSRYFRK